MNVDEASIDKLFFDAQQMMLDLASVAEKLGQLHKQYDAYDQDNQIKSGEDKDMSYLELSSRSSVNAYLQASLDSLNLAVLVLRGTTVACAARHTYLQCAHQA